MGHDKGPVLPSKKKKKKAESMQYLFKIGIVSNGHIFGEREFIDKNTRGFTATVTSTKAKLFRLSLKVTTFVKNRRKP